MEKQEIIRQIKSWSEEKAITREEVLSAYDVGAKTDTLVSKKLGIAEVLYYIGGGIVVLGIAILIGENWSTLSFPAQVLATLGASLVAYVVAFLFSRDEKTESVGAAFYLISAVTLPIGLAVILNNAGFDLSSAGVESWIAGISLAFFLASYFAFRKTIFTLFSIIFVTEFFWTFTSFLVGSNPSFGWQFAAYRVLVVGVSYVLIGYAFAKGAKSPLTGFLYGFGIVGFLAAALTLGGWSPSQNIFWELIFPVLALGTIFLSLHVKSKSFLTFGCLFLMAYILKITAEYFTNSLGWPLALVLAGLMLIAVGYGTFYLRRKYISS